MGKGDKKSKRGKLAIGTYGNSRSRKAIKARLKRTASRKAEGTMAEGEAATKTRRVIKKKAEA